LQYLPGMLAVDKETGAQAVPPTVIQSLFRTIVEALNGNTEGMPDPDVGVAAQIAADASASDVAMGDDFVQTRDALENELPESAVRLPPG